jgi:hypothetical protein
MPKFSLLFQNCLVSIGVLIDASMVASGVKDKEAGDVSRFLNRILGLSVEKQNLVMYSKYSHYDESISKFKSK